MDVGEEANASPRKKPTQDGSCVHGDDLGFMRHTLTDLCYRVKEGFRLG